MDTNGKRKDFNAKSAEGAKERKGGRGERKEECPQITQIDADGRARPPAEPV